MHIKLQGREKDFQGVYKLSSCQLVLLMCVCLCEHVCMSLCVCEYVFYISLSALKEAVGGALLKNKTVNNWVPFQRVKLTLENFLMSAAWEICFIGKSVP